MPSIKERGFELASRMNNSNCKADYRRRKRLGKEDNIVSWRKSGSIRLVGRKLRAIGHSPGVLIRIFLAGDNKPLSKDEFTSDYSILTASEVQKQNFKGT